MNRHSFEEKRKEKKIKKTTTRKKGPIKAEKLQTWK